MFHRWAALVLVLALCAMSPKNAAGQTQSPKPRGTSGFGQNYPNPFNPDTKIQLFVGDTTNNCANDRGQHVVSIEIRNIVDINKDRGFCQAKIKHGHQALATRKDGGIRSIFCEERQGLA